MNGKTRTDVITPATTLSAVKTAYDAAFAANPGNFIVLHLTAPQITGDGGGGNGADGIVIIRYPYSAIKFESFQL